MLQTLDTHCFASLKASLRRAKAHVNEVEEAGFTQLGQAYAPNWGPAQLASVVAEAWEDQLRRTQKSKWILSAAVENQLWIFRPDARGWPILVDQDESLQGVNRLPPQQRDHQQVGPGSPRCQPHGGGRAARAARL